MDLDTQRDLLYKDIESNEFNDKNAILQNETDEGYIFVFLQAIIPKVVDKTTREKALPIFKLLLDRAYENNVYLNDIPVEENLQGDTIFFYYHVEEAIQLIKAKSHVSYTINMSISNVKLIALRELNVDLKDEQMEQIIILSNKKDLLQLQKLIEHYKQKGHEEYIRDDREFINELPLMLIDILLQNNAIKLNEQNKILYGDIEPILELSPNSKTNFVFLNKKHYSYKDEHHNNLLSIFILKKINPMFIVTLFKLPFTYTICNQQGSVI